MKRNIYFLLAVIAVIAFTGCPTDAPGIEKAITAFSFNELATPVTAEIDGTSITITLPYGTDVTELIATFETTGLEVAIGGVEQVSGITPNNFSNPVSYTVTAEDGSSVEYIVTVIVAKNPAKDITNYSFSAADNSELSADVAGEFDGSVITVKVPYIADVRDLLDSLIATFTTTGNSVKVGQAVQNSGSTANDFASSVIYRVTAEDGSTKDYEVNVLITVDRTQLDAIIDDADYTSYVGRADTSNITNMNSLFTNKTTFNEDITGWDVSNVIDMNSMFVHANAFNQDISGWDVSSVENMGYMFYFAPIFNQDLSGWNVISVTDHYNFETGSPLETNTSYLPDFPAIPVP